MTLQTNMSRTLPLMSQMTTSGPAYKICNWCDRELDYDEYSRMSHPCIQVPKVWHRSDGEEFESFIRWRPGNLEWEMKWSMGRRWYVSTPDRPDWDTYPCFRDPAVDAVKTKLPNQTNKIAFPTLKKMR